MAELGKNTLKQLDRQGKVIEIFWKSLDP